jgi:hypothetical protein
LKFCSAIAGVNSKGQLYARFDPEYLWECKRALEGIIDEIETLVPGVFHRRNTGANEEADDSDAPAE